MLAIHGFGYGLLNKVQLMKNTFETEGKCNLVKRLPQRDINLDKLQKVSGNKCKGVPAFCPASRVKYVRIQFFSDLYFPV